MKTVSSFRRLHIFVWTVERLRHTRTYCIQSNKMILCLKIQIVIVREKQNKKKGFFFDTKPALQSHTIRWILIAFTVWHYILWWCNRKWLSALTCKRHIYQMKGTKQNETNSLFHQSQNVIFFVPHIFYLFISIMMPYNPLEHDIGRDISPRECKVQLFILFL